MNSELWNYPSDIKLFQAQQRLKGNAEHMGEEWTPDSSAGVWAPHQATATGIVLIVPGLFTQAPLLLILAVPHKQMHVLLVRERRGGQRQSLEMWSH